MDSGLLRVGIGQIEACGINLPPRSMVGPKKNSGDEDSLRNFGVVEEEPEVETRLLEHSGALKRLLFSFPVFLFLAPLRVHRRYRHCWGPIAAVCSKRSQKRKQHPAPQKNAEDLKTEEGASPGSRNGTAYPAALLGDRGHREVATW